MLTELSDAYVRTDCRCYQIGSLLMSRSELTHVYRCCLHHRHHSSVEILLNTVHTRCAMHVIVGVSYVYSIAWPLDFCIHLWPASLPSVHWKYHSSHLNIINICTSDCSPTTMIYALCIVVVTWNRRINYSNSIHPRSTAEIKSGRRNWMCCPLRRACQQMCITIFALEPVWTRLPRCCKSGLGSRTFCVHV